MECKLSKGFALWASIDPTEFEGGPLTSSQVIKKVAFIRNRKLNISSFFAFVATKHLTRNKGPLYRAKSKLETSKMINSRLGLFKNLIHSFSSLSHLKRS